MTVINADPSSLEIAPKTVGAIRNLISHNETSDGQLLAIQLPATREKPGPEERG
jgi:hypothetical protein